MTLEQLRLIAQKHGLTIFEAQPVVAKAFLLADNEQKTLSKPMTFEKLEQYLVDFDETADDEQ